MPITQTFGHDGRGSVQVLFDAAAAIAQVYTYSAYGELLAIHNGAAAVVGTIGQANLESLAATNKLYIGEGFDTRTGLYNFRARNYSASLGRFERLDPFAGNPTDPFSFNKYGFVHGNPVMGTDPTGMFLASSIGMVYNNIVVSIGDRMATDLFGLESGLDPSTLMLAKMLELMGVAVQWAGNQLSRGIAILEAGMFLESDYNGVSPTIEEEDAISYSQSALFLAGTATSISGSSGNGSSTSLGGLPKTTGSVSNFLRSQSKLAKYPINLIAKTGRRKVYVGSYSQLGTFNRNFGIDCKVWQRHHLNQNAVFEKLGIPESQGLCVNLKGAVSSGLQHSDFHTRMDMFWDGFRKSGTRPTVAQYNRELKKILIDVGYSPDEANTMTALARKQQEAYNTFENVTILNLPGKKGAVN